MIHDDTLLMQMASGGDSSQEVLQRELSLYALRTAGRAVEETQGLRRLMLQSHCLLELYALAKPRFFCLFFEPRRNSPNVLPSRPL